MANIEVGGAAPDFEAPLGDGSAFRLSAQRGRMVVLYFYPKDDTSGCTAEAIDFTQLKPDFEKAGASVVGISPDSAKKHAKFAQKHGLTHDLVADEERSAIEAYGLWVEKSMYGRKYMGVERTTVLVGPDGKILRIWSKVKVPGHAQEVLEAVKAEGTRSF
ncbi:MAG: peroxiredoxin [Methylobacterium mesophilicum]|nr:peroxiredoxin [Methylobacterium mesophilicum]